MPVAGKFSKRIFIKSMLLTLLLQFGLLLSLELRALHLTAPSLNQAIEISPQPLHTPEIDAAFQNFKKHLDQQGNKTQVSINKVELTSFSLREMETKKESKCGCIIFGVFVNSDHFEQKQIEAEMQSWLRLWKREFKSYSHYVTVFNLFYKQTPLATLSSEVKARWPESVVVPNHISATRDQRMQV